MARRRALWPWFVVPAVLVGVLVAYLVNRFPEAVAGEGERAGLVHSLLLLAFLGGSVVLHWRARPGSAFRSMAAWIAIGAVLFVGYSFRHEFLGLTDRLIAELLPHQGQVSGTKISFPANAQGHFVVEADVGGTRVRFLVDTGASDVSLSPADAERLGFDLTELDYTRRYRTANGMIRGAPVRLPRITIGPIELDDVRASVNEAPMKHSLLGMSFLERLSGYEVAHETLTLRR
jgi:aspartyl protease family protein